MKRNAIPMNLQFFAEASALDDLDSLLAGMDGDGAQAVEGTSEPEPQPQETEEPTVPTETKPQQQTQSQKMNYAFSQLRQQAANYKTMLTKLAQANGIDFKDESDLLNKLNDEALTKLSQRNNVSVDVLRRMDTLEQQNAAFEAQKRQSATLVGFQTLASKYDLDNDKLKEFAQRLDEAGMNPFVQEIDLESTYKTMYFDEIVQRQVEAAVQAALKKSSVADEHGTTPSSKSGKSSATVTEQVDTVSKLTDMLNNVKL